MTPVATMTDAAQYARAVREPDAQLTASVVSSPVARRMNRKRAPSPQAWRYMAIARRTPLMPAGKPG